MPDNPKPMPEGWLPVETRAKLASGTSPGPWFWDSYNTVFNEQRKQICSIPDHPHDDVYSSDESAERDSWYKESANNAALIEKAPALLAHATAADQRIAEMEKAIRAKLKDCRENGDCSDAALILDECCSNECAALAEALGGGAEEGKS